MSCTPYAARLRTYCFPVLVSPSFTKLEFLPKVFTKANMSWPICVPAMRNKTDGTLCKLCVHRALNTYMRCYGDYR